MTCEEARGRFSEAHDGELEAAVAAELERHLAGCGPCRRERLAYDETLTELGRYFERTAAQVRPLRPFPAARAGRGRVGAVARLGRAGRVAGAVRRPRASAAAATRRRWRSGRSRQRRPAGSRAAARCPWPVRGRRRPPSRRRRAWCPIRSPPTSASSSPSSSSRPRCSTAGPCDEAVRFTYRSGGRNLVLQQALASVPSCCGGGRGGARRLPRLRRARQRQRRDVRELAPPPPRLRPQGGRRRRRSAAGGAGDPLQLRRLLRSREPRAMRAARRS